MNILTKHIPCECKCKFGGRRLTRIKIGIIINVGVSAKIKKNIIRVKKIIF